VRKAAVALTLALGVAGLAAAAPAAPRQAAKAKVDWTRTVAATGAGGFRMGNPAAKVRLLEYGSLACPHCRHFAETGYKPLVQQYVRSGRVSYEFRNFLLNAPDISVSLLAHCAGPANFFPMSEAVFASQPEWIDKIRAVSDSDQAEIDRMSDSARSMRYAQIAGFSQLAAKIGVTPAKARQCLADPKGLQKLLAVTKKAEDGGVDRTPTFFINGKRSKAATWEQLEPELKAALGG
jgi:protein-disulfide isomerase